MFFVKCTTCGEPSVYSKVEEHAPDEYPTFHLPHARLLWPTPDELHQSVPRRVARVYAEASRIKSQAPNAFANQIRRALEAVCAEQGAGRKNADGKLQSLPSRLKTLENRGLLPGTLVAMTAIVKLLGDIGSHADDDVEVDPEWVDVIDDFFRAVVEYVYVGPWKVAEAQRALRELDQTT